MQFKKLAAITGSALMTGLALAGPVLATSVTALSNIADLVSVTDSTLSFPIFVIGANAATDDVAAAVDVAVNMASNAKTSEDVSCVGGGAVGITGGVSMATGTNPLVLWDNFSSSRQVLTATDLPEILASSNYVDQASVSVPYSQYLTFTNAAANGQIVYDTRSGGTQPELGLRFNGGSSVYTYLLAFTKRVSEVASTGTVTNMVNSQLNMLGKTWTITTATSGVDTLALTMLSGKNAQTVTTETPVTFTVDDKTYTVTLVAVGTISNVAAATLSISGGGLSAPQTVQVLTGGSKTLNDGTLLGVTSIFSTTKTGSIDSAVVFLGADKLELEDTNITDTTSYAGLKVNGETLTQFLVTMTGTATAAALTLNNIQIVWTPTLEQFLTPGNSLTDPASGGWKIFFGGISPAIDDTTNRETITITPSGTSAGLAFKTSDGKSLNQNFVKATSSTAVTFTDAGGYAIHVVEGELVNENEYVIVGQNNLAASAQNPFGHILRILSLENVTTSTSSIQDIASGTTMSVTGGNTTLYLDGQTYYLAAYNATHARITWGSSAANDNVGASTYDVYPAIMSSKGSWVSITNPVTITGLTQYANYTFNLPTGSVTLNVSVGTYGNTTVGTYSQFEFVNTSATSVTIRATNNQGVVAGGSVIQWTTPGILIQEGLDQSQGTTQNKYMDEYGSYVTYDSTAPGAFSLSYPSTQALAIVGVGKSPAAGSATAGGTVTTEQVLEITADVVYVDDEPGIPKTSRDLVLMGGPCINTLVADLATSGKFPYTCANWPGRDFGRVELIEDAFASGYTALVIAGTHAEQTDLAARIVQQGFTGASATKLAGSSVEVTGTVSSPAYS